MQTLTTAQAVVAMLEVNGIGSIYCLPGVQNDPFASEADAYLRQNVRTDGFSHSLRCPEAARDLRLEPN